MTRKKLAVSVSGQTRLYGKHWERFHKGLEDFFEDYDIDLYGHTWNNCPHSYAINTEQQKKFLSFNMTSNSEIWNKWVKEDIFARTPWRQSWNDNPQWKTFISGNDSGIIEFIKQRSIGAWAQIWSFNETISQIQETNIQYDGFIRYRWDNYFTEIAEEMQTTKNIIHNYIYRKKDFENTYYTGAAECISMGPQLLSHRTMQDVFMVFNNQGMDKLKNANLNWIKTLEKITYDFNENTHGPSSHELWATYLHTCGLIICANMPNIRSSLECEADGLIKENKSWNI